MKVLNRRIGRACALIMVVGLFLGLTGVEVDAAPAVPYWPGWDIVRGVTLVDNADPFGYPKGGYTSDGWGGLHAWGTAPAVTQTPYWPGWDISRGVAMSEEGVGVQVDGWGGLHPVRNTVADYWGVQNVNTAGSTYWFGWDIARGVSLIGYADAGVVVDGWGGLHTFGLYGDDIDTGDGPYWPGWDIVRDVAVLPDGSGGWILDGWGGVHPFGWAPDALVSEYWPGWDIARGIAMYPDWSGGVVIDGWGGVHPFEADW
jgi:hypothetical protein